MRGIAVTVIALASCIGAPTPLDPGISGSVGVPHRGVLTNGRALPKSGEGYKLFRDEDVRWGNPRLVSAIEAAASYVEQQRPGAPLVVADLSVEHGGKTIRHRSHRSGRDADLLFYVVTPDGRSVENPGFLHFAGDSLAYHQQEREYVRLDVERTWLLVKALVADPDAHVQFLFVAVWLEALLTEYARALGEEDELIYRAAVVLRQPSDSASHDDHIHMRIGCTPEEQVAGCNGGGPQRPWFEPRPILAISDDALLDAMFDGAGFDGDGPRWEDTDD